jgi:hypothetical protein
MKWQSQVIAVPDQTAIKPPELDLVVPFTTPDLTRAAIAAASRMGDGLHAGIRLVKVQCVPYPMDLDQSPVFLDFLRQQMESFHAPLPLTSEIRLAREFDQGLKSALHDDSVIVIAFRKRPWRTRNERLAAALQKDGRKVILLLMNYMDLENKENNYA